MADDLIKVGDKEYTPAQLAELVSKGEDYTKKTQSVAEERKAFQREREEFAKTLEAAKPGIEIYEELMGNADLANEVAKVAEKYRNADGKAPEQGTQQHDKMTAEMLKKIEALESKITSKEQAEELNKAQAKVDSAILANIKTEGIDSPKAIELLTRASWQFVMEKGSEITPDALKEFITEHAKEFKKDPAALKTMEAGLKDKDKTLDNKGKGGAQADQTEPARPGTSGFTDRIVAAFKKHGGG